MVQAIMKAGHAWHAALTQQEATELDSASTHAPTPIYRVRTWQRGACLYVAGSAAQFFSYAFAAQTLLLGISSVQFVCQLVCAAIFEHAAIPVRSMAAAAVIMAANVLLVVFGSKASEPLPAATLIALHRQAAYIGYLLAAAALAVACGAVFCAQRVEPPLIAGRAMRTLDPALLGVLAAVPGTQSVILGKCVSSNVHVTTCLYIYGFSASVAYSAPCQESDCRHSLPLIVLYNATACVTCIVRHGSGA